MSWQTCPKCFGEKTTENYRPICSALRVMCNICQGWGILNMETGLPPNFSSPLEKAEKEIEKIHNLEEKTDINKDKFSSHS